MLGINAFSGTVVQWRLSLQKVLMDQKQNKRTTTFQAKIPHLFVFQVAGCLPDFSWWHCIQTQSHHWSINTPGYFLFPFIHHWFCLYFFAAVIFHQLLTESPKCHRQMNSAHLFQLGHYLFSWKLHKVATRWLSSVGYQGRDSRNPDHRPSREEASGSQAVKEASSVPEGRKQANLQEIQMGRAKNRIRKYASAKRCWQNRHCPSEEQPRWAQWLFSASKHPLMLLFTTVHGFFLQFHPPFRGPQLVPL